MKDKFFKLLKDYNAYDAWVRGTLRDYSTVSEFMSHKTAYAWIDGAFTWSSNPTPGVDWSKLSSEWHKYMDR
jgi:hypothetical protein